MSPRQVFRILTGKSGADRHRRPPRSTETDRATFDRSNLAVGYGPGGTAGYKKPEPTPAPSEKPRRKKR